MLALILLSCVTSEPPKHEPGVVHGAPGTGDDSADSGPWGETGESAAPEAETGEQPGIDSGESGGDSGGGDSGAETGGGETGGGDTDEVCYPGEDWAWDVCFPLVSWDASWGEDYAYPDPYGGSAQYRAPARYLDLSSLDTDVSIAPNFELSEFVSASKGRYALFQTHVVESLQAIRDESGGPLTVNSGYRNVTYNESIGGAGSSRHMYGDGVDLVSSTLSLSELADVCEENGADYTQLYEAHVHCDWRDDALDPAFYDPASAMTSGSTRPLLSARLARGPHAWTAPALGFDEGEPLRVWTAWDAAGREIGEGTGREFVAPGKAERVRVVVGGRITVEARVDVGGRRL